MRHIIAHTHMVLQVMKRNCNEREESMTHPVDGYEMLMQFIVRQYRRGIRVNYYWHNINMTSSFLLLHVLPINKEHKQNLQYIHSE